MHNIDVEVKTQFVGKQLLEQGERYMFTYTIKLLNKGDTSVRLIGRHWVITDGDGTVQEVRGPGVVGEFPILKPDEPYEYSSAAMLNAPMGCMEGSYLLMGADGESFEAPVQPFRLAEPNSIQ